MEQTQYLKIVEKGAAQSHILRDSARAFWVGGSICTIGQGLKALYQYLGMSKDMAGLCMPMTLIFFACLFTGVGWFDDLAKYAGAGTLVPITGFANAVTSPALDCKSEGLILGLGAKMFTIAGPVLVYGLSAATLYGLIYRAISLFIN